MKEGADEGRRQWSEGKGEKERHPRMGNSFLAASRQLECAIPITMPVRFRALAKPFNNSSRELVPLESAGAIRMNFRFAF